MSFMLFQFCFTTPQRPYHWILRALKEIVLPGFLFFFFCVLDQQGPKAEKTKGVLNLNHADARLRVDLDQNQPYQRRNFIQNSITGSGALHSDSKAVAKARRVLTICFRKT